MTKFWAFMKAAPKASLMIPLVLLIQIFKRVGIEIPGVDEKLFSDILDLLSAVAGLYGLYYAVKAVPPESGGPATPSSGGTAAKVGMIIFLALALSLSACAGMTPRAAGPSLQDQWSKLTPDQQARVVIGGLQKQLDLQFDQAKVIVAANPQYAPVWKSEIVPLFDKANKALKALAETAITVQLTPEAVYAKMQPMINELAIKLMSIGMQKGGLTDGSSTFSSYAGGGIGPNGH